MIDIVIIGAGGLGREVAWMIQLINKESLLYRLLGFYDDVVPKDTTINGIKVLGKVEELNQISINLAVVIAIGDPGVRELIFHRLKNPNIQFPVLIHPRCDVGQEEYNLIGKGTIICAGTTITTNVTIGEFVLVNLHCTIGHDVVIGNFTSLMPDVNLSGHVNLGSGVLAGAGAVVLPLLNVEDKVKIGAGAVVTQSIRSNVTVVGVPAKETNP